MVLGVRKNLEGKEQKVKDKKVWELMGASITTACRIDKHYFLVTTDQFSSNSITRESFHVQRAI